jgi:hypothetical protein
MEPLDSQVGFLLEADRLKTVLRQTTLTDRSRRENSAEHSWHLALMAVVLAEHAPPGTDLGRVMAMVVLHDLVEIDAGDLFVYAAPADQARRSGPNGRPPTGSSRCCRRRRRPRSGRCGTSSRSGRPRRRSSPGRWTGWSPCSSTW